MDVVALASVISSGSVAALTLIANVVTKRGDRKHATNTEFQKRVWETKSEALLNLIKTCEEIRATIRRTHPDWADEGIVQKAAVFRKFNRLGYSISTPELVAYASDPVNKPVRELHDAMKETTVGRAWVDCVGIAERISQARCAKEEAIHDQDFQSAAEYRQLEKQLTLELGEAAGIDLEHVDRLCERIIAAARTDLRG